MPGEEDNIFEINGITVAIDPNIESVTQDLVLDFSKEANGLVLVGNESDCC
ncbi:hypothetical protein [Cytobacillus firmus]|uniref:HesB/YadR/YfhF-family protein n=1 Tax=Cytobacillus firmus DS1 TaxID=1307436 RepID=W7KYI2_CYTFI|nr:hypothetical protein [Cytobacillus firmus]EWG11168.1 HesB/YadR/YfhF-family protein [Cytobacillus firmus DS1]